MSEIDKKGKKKKGTLGIGNGAVFFASEADKVSFSFRIKDLKRNTSSKDPRPEMANQGCTICLIRKI